MTCVRLDPFVSVVDFIRSLVSLVFFFLGLSSLSPGGRRDRVEQPSPGAKGGAEEGVAGLCGGNVGLSTGG